MDSEVCGRVPRRAPHPSSVPILLFPPGRPLVTQSGSEGSYTQFYLTYLVSKQSPLLTHIPFFLPRPLLTLLVIQLDVRLGATSSLTDRPRTIRVLVSFQVVPTVPQEFCFRR